MRRFHAWFTEPTPHVMRGYKLTLYAATIYLVLVTFELAWWQIPASLVAIFFLAIAALAGADKP